MLKNRIFVFTLIIGAAIVFTGGVLAAEQFGIFILPYRQPTVVPLEIVVAPELADWAESTAETFNQRNADAQITVQTISGLSHIQSSASSSRAEQPHVWIPEATFLAAYAQKSGLPFAPAGQSLISTPLEWGAFGDRAAALDEPLTWSAIHSAAQAGSWQTLGGDGSWGYFKLTIAAPRTDAEGIAALISAAASFHNSTNIDRTHVTDAAFLAWLRTIVQTVPSFNTLGPDPAQAMAARGPSVGDVGLLAAASWARSQESLEKRDDFITQPTAHTVILDYPYLARVGLDSAEQDLADRFQTALLQATDSLTELGFTQQATRNAQSVEVDSNAIEALIQWVERERIGG